MIVFFPTYARRLPGERRWRATVAGMISRPLPPKSHRRTLAVGVIKRLLELDDSQLQSEVFQRRADAFLFQRVAGERVTILLGDRRIDAGQSDKVGHFHQSIDLDDDAAEALAAGAAGGCRWLTYEAARVGDEEHFEPVAGGRIQLVDDEGLSVISDIDDTVKVTNVGNRRELLANTLLREFYAVPGMAEIYRRWQEAGTAFHYVSASPWQLANCLNGFLRDTGLPSGSMHLKLFRLKDSTPLGRLPSRKRSKRRTIEQILVDFPRRKFLLVGDSGERDPEVYAEVARRHPDRVAGVAIRLVEGRRSGDKLRTRLDRLGRRLPAGRWHVFTEPAELAAWGG
ncbi:MAG: phosphatidate phosphatase App1 family protein [Planctomycetia bacterium]